MFVLISQAIMKFEFNIDFQKHANLAMFHCVIIEAANTLQSDGELQALAEMYEDDNKRSLLFWSVRNLSIFAQFL